MKLGFKNTVSSLGILSVLSIVGISFLTWRFCDDFRYEKVLETKGVFEYMYYSFINVDGRTLSFFSMIQMTLIKYFNLQIKCYNPCA